MDTLKAGKEIELRKDDRGLVVAIGGDMLFETGQYRLRGAAVPVLDAIATVLRRLPNRVVIEGHTDNVPVAGGLEKYSSNWELSTARAMSVLNYLIKKHVLVPARFSASGYAEFKPVASNETPEGRTKNRRVDVVIVSAHP
jgi:chemotaxis protein MotB